MAQIVVLHGPNLNLLGQREPQQYGVQSLQQINQQLQQQATAAGHQLSHNQSNSEGGLIDAVHAVAGKADLIIINPAGYTHTSVALRDALLAIDCPYIEVHLSNIYAREPFRAHSYFSDRALGVISGFGAQSYSLALSGACHYLTQQPTR